jgi:signal transduction histidine kinase
MSRGRDAKRGLLDEPSLNRKQAGGLRVAGPRSSSADSSPGAVPTLAAEVFLAEERERRRIAAGLHDQVGQLLATARMMLSATEKGAEADLEEIRNLLDQALRATRSLTFELSSPVLDQLGLNAALESLGEDLESRSGIRCRFRSRGRDGDVPEEAARVVYQGVKELLFNIVKHAEAHAVAISTARQDGHLSVMVEDDGRGFDVSSLGEGFGPSGGFGLFSLRECLSHLGGRLEIRSGRGRGTRVTLEVPLGAPATLPGKRDGL